MPQALRDVLRGDLEGAGAVLAAVVSVCVAVVSVCVARHLAKVITMPSF